jgi:TrmH family RNA methyltransferase
LQAELLSEHNRLVKQIRRAIADGGLSEDGFALAEGPHLIDEARNAGCEIEAVIVRESSSEKYLLAGARVASDKLFRDLSTTESPQGVLALVRPRAFTFAEIATDKATLILLDGIQDPGNAGAILRAAEAFGTSGCVFLKGSVNPYNPKCIRGSAGSVFRMPLVAAAAESVLDSIKTPLYAAIPGTGKTILDADLKAPFAIAIGSEGHGVSSTVAARATALRIPTRLVESLNAAVAAGIILYEAQRQRESK